MFWLTTLIPLDTSDTSAAFLSNIAPNISVCLAWLSTLTSDQAFCFFFSSHWSKITTILIGLICYSALKQNRKQRRTISQPGGLSIASGRQFKRVKCLLGLFLRYQAKQSMCRPNMRKQSTDDWLLQTLTSNNAVIRPAWYHGRVQGTPY